MSEKKAYARPVVTERKIELGVYGDYRPGLTDDDRKSYYIHPKPSPGPDNL